MAKRECASNPDHVRAGGPHPILQDGKLRPENWETCSGSHKESGRAGARIQTHSFTLSSIDRASAHQALGTVRGVGVMGQIELVPALRKQFSGDGWWVGRQQTSM